MSIHTTYSYNSNMTLTDLLTLFPDNTNNEVSAKDVRDTVKVLWERMDVMESSPYTFNATSLTTVQVGGINRGTSLDGMGIGDILSQMLFPSVPPSSRINIGSLNATTSLPIPHGSTSVQVFFEILRGSLNIQTAIFDNNGVTTQLSPISNNPTQLGSLPVSLSPNVIGDTTITLTLTDTNNVTSVSSLVLKVYPKCYYGAISLNTLINPNRPTIDYALFPEQVNETIPLITTSLINGLQFELRQTPIGLDKHIELNNQNLIFIVPNNIPFNIFANGMMSTSFKRVKTQNISGISYDVWVSNTAHRAGLQLNLK